MSRNGKSNSFLIGRIYERTEQNSKILPVMQQDISEMKQKHLDNFYQIKDIKENQIPILRKRVKRVENTSLSCILRNAGKGLINLLLGRLKP